MARRPVSPRRRFLWNKASLCGVGAIVCQLCWNDVLTNFSNPPFTTRLILEVAILILLSLILWVLSCSAYAQSKGYSKTWGAAGIVTCVGFALLMLLPSRWRDEPESGYLPGDYPRPTL